MERKLQMPSALVGAKTWAGGNWYEEDSDWAIVPTAFPEHFSGYSQFCAARTMRKWHKELWAEFIATPEGREFELRIKQYTTEHGDQLECGCCGTSGNGWGFSANSLDGKRRIAFWCKEYPKLPTPFTVADLDAAGFKWEERAP